MNEKLFYKMRLVAEEEGLQVQTETFILIHETPCFWFATNERNRGFFIKALMNDGETPIQFAKRKKIKVHKFEKGGSRFAFETQQEAYKHLKWMKRRQLRHIERQALFIKEFLEKSSENYNDLPTHKYHESWPNGAVGIPSKTIPDTRELVHEHLTFY